MKLSTKKYGKGKSHPQLPPPYPRRLLFFGGVFPAYLFAYVKFAELDRVPLPASLQVHGPGQGKFL